MNKMDITSVQYMKDWTGKKSGLKVILDDNDIYVPLDLANTDYAEIMRQVDAGELTIEPADE